MKQLLRAAVTALFAVSALNGMALAQETAPMETLSATEPAIESIEVTDMMEATEGLSLASPAPVAPVAPVAFEASEAKPAAVSAQRYFLLLFDSPIGSLTQLDEVGEAVEGWIATALLPTDTVAVVSYYGQEIQIAQDFTRDRDALRAAVDDAIRGRSHQGIPADGSGPSLLERLPQGGDPGERTESFYGVLQLLAGAVDSVPGPKKLLVFSRGFGRARAPEPVAGFSAGFSGGFSGMVAGPELGIAEEVLATSPLLEKYLEKYLPATELYEPTLEALLSREIQLYPFDLATDYRETYPLAGVMSRLAAETDGRYVYPVTNLAAQLQQVARTTETGGDRLAVGPVGPEASRGLLQE
ncbi:MAG TPA: hypothetical protein VJ885_01350 [Thermoanaerobaculia bacterium]|nr:hypothetical protein [Thermoanaerobaculia bacterium]